VSVRPGELPEDSQRQALSRAFRHAGLTLEDLWTRHFALGGELDLVEVEGYLAGLLQIPETQRDVLAHAVNERLDELTGQWRAPYSRTVLPRRPPSASLAALVQLLKTAHHAPTGRLAAIAAGAGRELGVEVRVHLADHEQQRLRPLVTGDGERHRPLRIDGTLAGRAFETGDTLTSDHGGQPRLWVPLLDGADRLGVLEVRLRAFGELHDPALREQCGWVAGLVAHLISSMGRYGDDLERVRRSRPRSTSAELLWQQLPPLTAATNRFVLSGLVEPSYDAGGDAFDYALTERCVSLAIFDAMGHGLPAALMAAGALAGYRSARRDGRSIFDQAQAIDAVVSTSFTGSAFVTGVLCELDVATGRLRYLRAGHPPPLLLRDGKIVRALTDGHRVPFGLETDGFAVAEEVLQPGDWLVLHTDGITEARDASGAWFGEDRLADLLGREAAAGYPPPETVRRLVRAVLAHQGGLLQDDATVLLAEWLRDGPG
jgi:Stage II sporulation protein E (SpoIIE)